MIQLSLNDLLGKIKASPKNDTAELEWKEDRVRALRARQSVVLLSTLTQALNAATLSIIFNPTSQSSCLSRTYERDRIQRILYFAGLRDSKRLRSASFCTKHRGVATNRLSTPFFKYTTVKVPWKQLILSSLKATQEKLSKYYAMTDSIEGDLYAIGTILAPANKLQFFSTKD
ncbi:hypothetical protein N7505_007571 [Penicillium chrysogenum]|uniref:Uncharacterized protein n=1 Tax=Penicillium chrysogenum TaxID=5076 RepID=A0ABQ8WF48_PENCH|nr:hypothetical protein N7505_007571 [Penicillium chrysogenum]